MFRNLAKCNFKADAKSVGKFHNQTYVIGSPHLWASQDLPTTAINLRAKSFLSCRQQLFTGLKTGAALGNFHLIPFL